MPRGYRPKLTEHDEYLEELKHLFLTILELLIQFLLQFVVQTL